MGNSNKAKDTALKMPHGTAAAKLRKSILFMLLKKHYENFCFKCGAEIESVDELTIEHKVPWLYSDDPIGLFFDLDNIAFSHAVCNRPHRVKQPANRQKDDMLRCGSCKQYKPITRFSRDKNRYDGRANSCLDCRAERKRIRRAKGIPARLA